MQSEPVDDRLLFRYLSTLLLDEMKHMKQDTSHLIYPLNYSCDSLNLIALQESFYDQYILSFASWVQENILNHLSHLNGNDDCDNENEVEQRVFEISDALRYFNSSMSLDERGKLGLLRIVLVAALPDFGYDSRTRTLLLNLARRLKISECKFILQVEDFLVDELVTTGLAADKSGNGDNRKRWIFAGIGAIAGALAASVTAGLAAPIVIPTILSVLGVGGVTFLSGAGGIALMATVFGVAGAGLTGYRVSQRFSLLKDFTFCPLKSRQKKKLSVFIGISGWIKKEEDLMVPWQLVTERNQSFEAFAIVFERKVLLNLGRALQDYLTSSAVAFAATEALKMTILSAATTAILAPVAILQAGDFIDNPWSVGLDRARQAGRVLADALARKRSQGHRPVTLAGYSLGALVILSCLQELIKMTTIESDDEGEEEEGTNEIYNELSSRPIADVFGIIENVVLLGLPAHALSSAEWNQLRLLVSGRFIHGYSRNDWILRYLYRSHNLTFSADEVVGLAPIKDVPLIESIDLSEMVKGHLEYQTKLSDIFDLINL